MKMILCQFSIVPGLNIGYNLLITYFSVRFMAVYKKIPKKYTKFRDNKYKINPYWSQIYISGQRPQPYKILRMNRPHVSPAQGQQKIFLISASIGDKPPNGCCEQLLTSASNVASRSMGLKLYPEALKNSYKKNFREFGRKTQFLASFLLFYGSAWVLGIPVMLPCFMSLDVLGNWTVNAANIHAEAHTYNVTWPYSLHNEGRVARTAGRPIASGSLSMFDAFVLLGAQLGVGALILLQLDIYSIMLGASSLGLVILYPLMKRITYWPQLMLGFTFNWGALLGWSAVHGSVDWSICLPLYAAGISWTMIYDTIYAHQGRSINCDNVLVCPTTISLRFLNQTKIW
ncbi:unnamed protein product, partial [Meganyctiphanes norvegica]